MISDVIAFGIRVDFEGSYDNGREVVASPMAL